MRKALLTLSVIILFNLFASAQKEGLASIKKEDMKSHLEFFASDLLQGREMGTDANSIAALYLKTNIQRMGLQPDVDDYFQHMPLSLAKNTVKDSYLKVLDSNGTTIFSTDSVMQLMPLSATLEEEGNLVFAGFGYENEEKGYSDLKDIDVKDKIVLLMTRTPEMVTANKDDGSFSFRVEEVKIGSMLRKGARGFLYVLDPAQKTQDPFESVYYQFSSQEQVVNDDAESLGRPLIFGFIKPAVADRLLAPGGKTLRQYCDQIISTGKPASFDIPGRTVSVKAAVEKRRIDGKNVIGKVEGSDPVLKNECVIYTAHFDHVGVNNGKIYNGADDDASGSIGLLEIANAFMSLKKKPLRTIVFAWVNGEEKGLIGSGYYVKNPSVPLDRTLLDINLDMIGRSATPADTGKFFGFDVDVTKKGEVMMYTKHESTDLSKIIEKSAAKTGISIRDMGPDIEAGGSDHESFWEKDVTAVMFHTGVHADTHQDTDDVDRIDFDKMEQVTKLAFLIGYEVANRREGIRIDKKTAE